MCDAPGATTEHVPPRCFFPEAKDVEGLDLRVNLITVPSCPAHNSQHANDDQYAMVVVAMQLDTAALARNQFSTKCMRALKRSDAFRKRVFNRPRNLFVKG